MLPGQKEDTGKDPWDLLPWTAVQAVVRVIEFGARKYAPNDWRNVPHMKRRYFAALMRHMYAWVRGEKIAPDSGLHHLAHAATNALFLLEIELGGKPADLDTEGSV